MSTAMNQSAIEREFAEYLARHRMALIAMLRRLAPRDAEDLLQEAMTRAWRYRGSWDPARSTRGWLLQTGFRCVIDHRRKLRCVPQAADELARSQSATPPCTAELRDEVERVLDGLTAIERTLLLGFHRDDRTLLQLAADHDLPLNTVKSHLRRAREKLRRTAAENADHD